MPRTSNLEREWARRGAAARLDELNKELASIYRSFPELRRGRSGAGAPAAGRRRRMSADARRRMSEGMKKYWARRKAKSKG